MNAHSPDKLHNSRRIEPLLGCEPKKRDFAWLEQALQSAVSIEFSTIPPYLCALWSIKNEQHPVAKSIRNVVHEEMLHMSLACNMLTAIGCVPQINHPNMVPRYPGPIPGGIHPDLKVRLSGFSPESLKVFIEIEAPSTVIKSKNKSKNTSRDVSIGAFYMAISEAFDDLNPKISTERQVSGPLAFMVMDNLKRVKSAISVIIDQGEGSAASAKVARTHELAHYYRFLEIEKGQQCTGVKDGQAIFDGEKLEFPEVWPMAEVPENGYLRADVPADVWHLVEGCDRKYTEMLGRLQAVWETGGQAPFVGAIESMFGLSQLARPLMQKQIGNGPSTYGPCFRLLSGAKTAPKIRSG